VTFVGTRANHYRNMPKLRIRLASREIEKPPLTDLESGSVFAGLSAYQREAWLKDPAIHHFADRLMRRLFERIPEVSSLGVCECFCEPDAIPPLHRHEVAKPHMRILVRNNVGDTLQLGT